MLADATVLWDLDGTLTNPFLGITRSIQFALRELGLEAPGSEQLRHFIGPPLQVSFRQMVGDDADLVDKAVRLYRQRYAETGKFENELIAGIPRVLAELKSSDARLFVATSKLQTYSVDIVDHFHLSQFFDGIFGSELDGARSDKGELIRHIIEVERLHATRKVMIGDRLHDIHGAARNGIKTIGVLWGFGDRAELEAAGAISIAEQPGDLPELIGHALA